MIRKLFLSIVVVGIAVAADERDNTICNLPEALVREIENYGPAVHKIIGALTNGKFKGRTYAELAKFVDKFGARVSGTQNLENAIDYILEEMKDKGLKHVHGENVTVPHWVRGEESAELLHPRKAKIEILSLGGSVATPPEGITAEVLVVRSFEELDQHNFTKAAKGKIVVFNNDFVSYGVSVVYRSQGASRAAKVGAVAALIRSVTPFSQYTVHTGQQGYPEGVTKIPAISITVEDARMFQRLQDQGQKIVIKLKTSAKEEKEKVSRNVVGEIGGREIPKKVVLVSGHIDSWDVGVGAMDDGGGAFISWYSLAVLKELGLKPRRTLRCVLWTAEEEGLIGVQAYNEAHKDELDDFTFVMESDEGTFTPLGIAYATGPKGGCIIQEIVKLLAPINATQTESSESVGSDITIWAGVVPTGSLLNANDKYFWFHHTQADRMDVLDPDALDKATAVWAAVSYVIADLSEEFPRDFDNSANAPGPKLLEKLKLKRKN